MAKMDLLEIKKTFLILFDELDKAVDDMLQDTYPVTPIPRARIFKSFSIEWPAFHSEKNRSFKMVTLFFDNFNQSSYALKTFQTSVYSQDVLEKTWLAQMSLAETLRAIRILQSAINWCMARKAGRKKMSKEIEKQSKRKMKAIQKEVTWYGLK